MSALFDICMELQSLALSVVAALFISWERFSLAGEGKPSYKKIQKVGFSQLMVDPYPPFYQKVGQIISETRPILGQFGEKNCFFPLGTPTQLEE